MIDEEVTAVVVAVIVVVGFFAVSQTVFAGRVVEPFSNLAVLGPNMKIGDYPRELVAGETFDLFLYLENQEGRVMYYRVLVKLEDRGGDVSNIWPLDTPVLVSFDSILVHGGNQTIPVILSLADAGTNQRLVFELHSYNLERDGFGYHGRWCQLWLNVTRTRPPS